jgi:hypothetical protein
MCADNKSIAPWAIGFWLFSSVAVVLLLASFLAPGFGFSSVTVDVHVYW